MSFILSIYSEKAYKEILLPAINDSDYELNLSKETFGLQKDVLVKMEVLNGSWDFVESQEYEVFYFENGETCFGEAIKKGDFLKIVFSSSDELYIIVRQTESSFAVYSKFILNGQEQITIGSASDCNLQFQFLIGERSGLISHSHAKIVPENGGFSLYVISSNVIFINAHRVTTQSQKLQFGDLINVFGLKIIFLGNFISVNTDVDGEKVQFNNLQPYQIIDTPVEESPEKGTEKDLFYRSPRNIPKIEKDPIEIEAAPAAKEDNQQSSFAAIGPSMTMALPMLLGSGLTIASASSSGRTMGPMMFAGIVTAVSSSAVGTFWSIKNMKTQKKKNRADELKRFDMYSDYLVRCSDEIKEKYDKNTNALREMYHPASDCVKFSKNNIELWNRNVRHPDFIYHRLGIGQLPFQVEINVPKERFSLVNDTLNERPRMIKESYKMLNDVPIGVDLMANKLIGLLGGENYTGCYQIVRNIVAQIVATNCYTDVKLAFIFNGEGDENGSNWSFAKWLPHVWSGDGKSRYIATDKAGASDIFYEIANVLRYRAEEEKDRVKKDGIITPYYIVFIENPKLLDGELLAKYVYDKENNYGITTILLVQRYAELPNACEYIIENTREYQGMYSVTDDVEERIPIRYDSISKESLEYMGRTLAGVRIKEESTNGEIPNSLTFFDMYGITRLEELNVIERWRKNRTYESLRALIGQKAGGADCYLDVHEKFHGPHGLVAGTTGSGKSETLQTYMLSLALNFSPDDVGFFIIDYKGGGMANLFNGLPHMLGQISNLSGNQVRRAMVSIKSEIRRRQQIFGEYGVNNINLYTRLYKNNEASIPIPHMFIIIDEFAELKREESDFMRELISVAQVGRSLGVHLILATQKPAGTVDDNIWSNSKFRLCLRVQDRQDSMDMLHKPDAAYITQAGRSYMQVGNDELYELFQSGWSGATYVENGSPQTDIAKMLGINGRAALVGNHAQLLQKEENFKKWMSTLINISNESLRRMGCNILSEKKNVDEFVKTFFTIAEEQGIDYPVSNYNANRIQDFLYCYEACAKNTDNTSNMFELIEKYAAACKKKLPEKKEKTQLDAVVEYIAKVAEENHFVNNLQLWLPVLPTEIYLSDLDGYSDSVYDGEKWPELGNRLELTVPIGLYDDPENQAQNPVMIDLAECGNLAVLGTTMSGKSTFLMSYVYAMAHKYHPEAVNFYILDFSSKMLGAFADLPHVGDVMFEDELEKVDKFFTFLNRMLQERKELLRGGNYSQYVRANGVTMPAIAIIIDNYASFRTKTGSKYDDLLLNLMKEANSYGIYFIFSAANFSTGEIPGRMGDLFKEAVTLEMNDRYAYSDALHVMRIDITPEQGVRGRGLVKVGESVLEFQTALSIKAEDDFNRGEQIRKECKQMASVWTGNVARPIPTIPDEPMWTEYSELDDVKKLIATKCYLPFGYDQRTASVYGIDLRNIYAYLISGRSRSGKTNALKILALSAQMLGGKCVILDLNGELKRFSETSGIEYAGTEDEVFNYFERLIPDFKARNQAKKQAVMQGVTNEELYTKMLEYPPVFIFIGDLVRFCQAVKYPKAGIDDYSATMCNLLDKGVYHNVFWFGCFNPDQTMDIIGNDVFNMYTKDKVGIHLGGNVQNQKLLSYDYIKYSDQSKKYPAGVGVLPTHEEDDTKVVVVPFCRL